MGASPWFYRLPWPFPSGPRQRRWLSPLHEAITAPTLPSVEARVKSLMLQKEDERKEIPRNDDSGDYVNANQPIEVGQDEYRGRKDIEPSLEDHIYQMTFTSKAVPDTLPYQPLKSALPD
ncbi:hypothetical protein NLG97_g2668 [Lecanicillium saksenae]|uniref:Uncharacterized protein n=1 Tax=Lecanicillium saksenae TaxID=468837 RepID=A0ACC1R1I3_9HYPO|nr:hypothetical protein NLG97_g2668 [Lecanicillium saksenae]